MATFQKELYLKEPHILKKKKKRKELKRKEQGKKKKRAWKAQKLWLCPFLTSHALGAGPVTCLLSVWPTWLLSSFARTRQSAAYQSACCPLIGTDGEVESHKAIKPCVTTRANYFITAWQISTNSTSLTLHAAVLHSAFQVRLLASQFSPVLKAGPRTTQSSACLSQTISARSAVLQYVRLALSVRKSYRHLCLTVRAKDRHSAAPPIIFYIQGNTRQSETIM